MLNKAEHKPKTISALMCAGLSQWETSTGMPQSRVKIMCEQSQAVHVKKRTPVRAKMPMWLPVCFRAVTESINQLITLCTQQAAGQKECDNALRELEVDVLTCTEPHTETSYSSGLFLSPVQWTFIPSISHSNHCRGMLNSTPVLHTHPYVDLQQL